MRHHDVWHENFVHQNKVLCVIYAQMCKIGNTDVHNYMSILSMYLTQKSFEVLFDLSQMRTCKKKQQPTFGFLFLLLL